MKTIRLLLLLQMYCAGSLACSAYKITLHGKTFMGNNEDYWNANTRIWFEKGKNGGYGSMYVGFDNLFPQGGMNEKGLAFDGFAVEARPMKKNPDKAAFDGKVMRSLMQTCGTVDEAVTHLDQYDLSGLSGGMLLLVDASGKYLVVEGDTMIKGNDPSYLLSNFCPSRTPDPSKVRIPFYQRGRRLMEQQADTSIAYLKTLSDSLHQDWGKGLGGTLYTTIYDLNERSIRLYFYHDYSRSITFQLDEQLKKKDAVIAIPSLFPGNKEGQEHFKRFNTTREFVSKLRKSKFSSDSSAIAAYIKEHDIAVFLRRMEMEINDAGYDLMEEKDKQPAINVFRLNMQYSPNSWNVYDSMGDGYYEDKQFTLALKYYKRSLELNPDNQNAIDRISLLSERQ